MHPYAQVAETHSGVVMMVGDRAYKVKRPVVTDFLDFSTRDRREAALRRELELNARLAPQAYLGIAHLQGPEPGPGEPVLVMQRYPDTERLATRVRAGTDGLSSELNNVAAVLADFHLGAARGPRIDAAGRPAAVTKRWDDNLTELGAFTEDVVPAALVDEIGELTHRYLSGRAVLFAERIAGGRIVDGHADLLADDIFCGAGAPVLLDCLDFDDKLRFVDGLDDAACLAMDLEFLGRPDLAEEFLDRYCGHAADRAPKSLRHFYIAYRAVMRGKIDCIRYRQGHPEAKADALAHLELGLRHLRAATVRLVLVGGGPGTGKTTLATALADELGAQVLSTDDIRRELVRDGVIVGESGTLDTGLYTAENIDAVYAAMLRRARIGLGAGHSVILDGTWADPEHRQRAQATADGARAAFVELECAAPLERATARIATRTDTTSEVTGEIAAAIAERREPGYWPSASRVDTCGSVAEMVAQAREYCAAAR